jgi:Kef-type K+ transport system membrane component KefB
VGSLISIILLAVAIIVIGVLLIGAYVVVPIIGWLTSNPMAGVGLLVILFVLVVALVYNVAKD